MRHRLPDAGEEKIVRSRIDLAVFIDIGPRITTVETPSVRDP